MVFIDHFRTRFLLGWLLLAFAIDTAGADDPLGSGRIDRWASETAGGAGVVVGITGHYRVGRWTAVRFDSDQAAGVDSDQAAGVDLDGGGEITLETLDGDGVRTIYRQRLDAGSRRQGYCVPGGEAVPLVIRGESGIEIRTRFPESGTPARGASLVPLGMPWVVAIGEPLGVETVGANELLGREAQVAVSIPRGPEDLPESALGYDGVDMMLVNDAGRELLQGLDDRQTTAIVDWVRGGGRLLVSLGESAPQLLDAAPWLHDLLPFEPDGLTMAQFDPSGFETYMSSQTQLQPFAGAVLPRSGRTLVSGRTSRRESAALASDYIIGLGRVTLVAIDLHRPPMDAWPERLELIVRLTDETLKRSEDAGAVLSRMTGFDDLAGQTRTMLDQFQTKRQLGFSIITLIVVGLIALIGPLDYWFVNRVLRRPAIGWITFPAVCVAISLWLIFQSRPRDKAGSEEDPTFAINRLEITDIDAVEKLGRGFAWSYVYSHPARRIDLNVEAGTELASVAERMDRMLTAPFGWPGPSFGGIQLAGEDARMPAYVVDLRRILGSMDDTRSGTKPLAMERQSLVASVRDLPLAPRSSKSMATAFSFSTDLPDDIVVSRRRGSELLEGGLTNPLPFDLLDGMLVYRDWAYLLPTRFPAGSRIEALRDLRQKNFRWHLSRQRAIEESSEGQAWDPSRFDDPARIAEMLMFHRAVGGRRYTTLRHEPLSFLDLSSLLTEDRCMLVGRLAEPLTRLEVDGANQLEDNGNRQVDGEGRATGLPPSGTSPPGQSVSLLRLILPVETTVTAAL